MVGGRLALAEEGLTRSCSQRKPRYVALHGHECITVAWTYAGLRPGLCATLGPPNTRLNHTGRRHCLRIVVE
jgi:hypothetical protein